MMYFHAATRESVLRTGAVVKRPVLHECRARDAPLLSKLILNSGSIAIVRTSRYEDAVRHLEVKRQEFVPVPEL